MKRIIVLLFSALISLSAYTQFNVDSRGHVLIGKYADGTDRYVPLSSPLDGVIADITYLLDTISMCKMYGPFAGGAGARISFGGDPYPINNKPRVAIGELGRTSTDALQLHGYKGIYITSSNSDTVAFYKPDNAFQFNCDVKTTGMFINSDERFKTDIRPLTSSACSIGGLTAVSYTLKNVRAEKGGATTRYGFIAQEVEAVYPELVQTDSAGYKYVDYIGMIPLLVGSLKAIEVRCDSLENVINGMKKTVNSVPTSDGTAQGFGFDDVPVLYQNEPNPFSASTKISCYLPYQLRDAKLYVYDLQGAQKLCKEVQGRGKTSVTINASELQAGMYLYSLIVDGREIDSKRMILTD